MDVKQAVSLDLQSAARAPGRRKGLFWRIARETLPAWVFPALIAAWWAAVAILKVPAFLLPPSRMRG